jgi:hypothetical protein
MARMWCGAGCAARQARAPTVLVEIEQAEDAVVDQQHIKPMRERPEQPARPRRRMFDEQEASAQGRAAQPLQQRPTRNGLTVDQSSSSPPTPPHQTWAEPAGRATAVQKICYRLYDSERVARTRQTIAIPRFARGSRCANFVLFLLQNRFTAPVKDMVRSGTILRRRQAGTPSLSVITLSARLG